MAQRSNDREQLARFRLGNRVRHALPAFRQRLPLGLALILLICLLGAGTVAIVGWAFPGLIRYVGERRAEHPVQRRGELAGALFYEMMRANALVFDPLSGRLEVSLDCAADLAGISPTRPDLLVMTRRYCRSDIGHAVQGEIALWNRSVTVLAVRDDRAQDEPCDPKTGLVVVHYAPEGCHPAHWQAMIGAGARAALIGGEVDEHPSPELFGFVARGVATTYTSWRRIDTSFAGAEALTFETRLRLPRRVWNVDVLGDVTTVIINGRPVQRSEGDVPPAGGYVRTLLCDAPGGTAGCERLVRQPGNGSLPRGTRLTFNLDVGREHSVSIGARPLVVVPEFISERRKARFLAIDPQDERVSAPDWVRFLTPHIMLVCDDTDGRLFALRTGAGGEIDSELRDEGGPGDRPGLDDWVCGFRWQTRDVATPLEPGIVKVHTRGAGQEPPLVLTRVEENRATSPRKKRIVATDDAARLGLLPIVGLDSADLYSLTGQLRLLVGPGQDRRIDLSIDPALQEVTESILRDAVTRKIRIKNINDALDRKFDARRRAVLILIDGGQAGGGVQGGGFDALTGRILAVSSYPRLDGSLSKWDVDALDRFRPTSSPLATRGWSAADRFLAPGSSFKPLVALAAIDRAARGDALVRRFLGADEESPGLDAKGIANVVGDRFGYSFTARQMRVPAGDDGSKRTLVFGNFRRSSKQARRSQLCAMIPVRPPCQPNSPTGLHDALVTSSNLWFGRLALLLDEDKVTFINRPSGTRRERTEGKPGDQGVPDLSLGRMVQKVWPQEARALVPWADGKLKRIGGRIRAEPIVIDAVNPRQPRRVSLALNGFGQAAQATPLAMASLMSTIATGVIVYPRLTPAFDLRPGRGAPLLGADASEGPVDNALGDELMRNLRRSLADVVRQPQGTAHGAFTGPGKRRSPLFNRIYGKTGTAQVGSPKVRGKSVPMPNTVWFNGWLEGLRAPGYEGRRIAFACAITHVDRGFGAGKVCAPLVRRWLERLEALQNTAEIAR